MSFDFWAVANSAEFQEQSINENEASSGSYAKFEEPGEYDVEIKHAEIRETKAGDQKLTLRVRADSGESGFWDLLVGHGGGSSKCAKIAQQNLALILRYSGAKATNPNALIGLKVRVWVKIEENDGYEPRPVFRPIGSVYGTPDKPAAPKIAAPKVPSPSPARQEPEEDIEDDEIPF